MNSMWRHVKKAFFLFIIPVFLMACSRNDDTEKNVLVFVGDSQIALWDIAFFFPEELTYNCGKCGAQIDYLEKFVNTIDDSSVIIEIGTNDIKGSWSNSQVISYVDRYINAVNRIKGKKIIVIDVLPTSDLNKNKIIRQFNSILRDKFKNTRISFVEAFDVLIEDGLIKEDLTTDGLHLSEKGYLLLTNLIKEEL